MKTRARYLVIAGIIMLGIAVALLLEGRSKSEPRVQGRRLSEWISDLATRDTNAHNRAREALREVSNRPIPFLLAELECKDSFLKERLVALAKRYPFLPFPRMSAEDRHRRAILAIRILGLHSSEVIEVLSRHLLSTNAGLSALNALISVGESDAIRVELVRPLTNALASRDVRVRRTAASAMRRVPLDDPDAVHALQGALSDADQFVQRTAASTLMKISTNPSVVVPACMKLFEQGNPTYQRIAVDRLIGFENSATNAIPLLMKAAMEQDSDSRQFMIYGLGRIHSDAERVIPFLVTFLGDTNVIVRRNAIFAITAFGNEASNAIPQLLKLKEDPDSQVRNAVIFALRKIEKDHK